MDAEINISEYKNTEQDYDAYDAVVISENHTVCGDKRNKFLIKCHAVIHLDWISDSQRGIILADTCFVNKKYLIVIVGLFYCYSRIEFLLWRDI